MRKTTVFASVFVMLGAFALLAMQGIGNLYSQIDAGVVRGGVTCYTIGAAVDCANYGNRSCGTADAHAGVNGNCDYSSANNSYTCPYSSVTSQNANIYHPNYTTNTETGLAGINSPTIHCYIRKPCNQGGACTVITPANGNPYGYCKSGSGDNSFGDDHTNYDGTGWSACI